MLYKLYCREWNKLYIHHVSLNIDPRLTIFFPILIHSNFKEKTKLATDRDEGSKQRREERAV